MKHFSRLYRIGSYLRTELLVKKTATITAKLLSTAEERNGSMTYLSIQEERKSIRLTSTRK